MAILLCSICAILCCTASAVDFSGWKQIEVDESLVNSSSVTVFSVMLPPGYSNQTIDAPTGAVTNFINETNPNTIISIMVIENTINEQLNDNNSKDLMDSFMTRAGITPLEGTEPLYLEDGGIVEYGTTDSLIAGVYISSTDENVILTTGFYNTQDDAIAGMENLALVASTIEILSSE